MTRSLKERIASSFKQLAPLDQHSEQVWPFNDAPRWMCVESVGKLPDLFDRLISQSVDTTEKIKARTIEAEELAAGVRTIRKEVEQAEGAKKGRK